MLKGLYHCLVRLDATAKKNEDRGVRPLWMEGKKNRGGKERRRWIITTNLSFKDWNLNGGEITENLWTKDVTK